MVMARAQKPFRCAPALRMWLFPQLGRHKQTKTDKKTKRWTKQRGWNHQRRNNMAECFQSCHSTEYSGPDKTHKYRISGQPRNTCAESKGSVAEKKVWRVLQLCGCRRCRPLWSSVLRCDRALANSEPGAGWGWCWTGPYGLSESVRKGSWRRTEKSVLKHKLLKRRYRVGLGG